MIQRAGIEALAHPDSTERITKKYQRRLGNLVSILRTNGFRANMPDGTFFLYVQAPKGINGGAEFKDAEEASQYMLLQQGISVVPWDDVGHFLRFSATFESGRFRP